MYLTNAAQNYVLHIDFLKRTPKTRLSRLIKELNDLCTIIYRTNKREVNDWILISPNNCFNKINASVKVDYISLYCTIKILRTKFIKLNELLLTTQKNLKLTMTVIEIIESASRRGYLNYYNSIKRKYLNRKKNQEKKLLSLNCSSSYVCTIKFFFLWLIKIILTTNNTTDEDICNELDILMIEEYINFHNNL